jgi:hypothetical protein
VYAFLQTQSARAALVFGDVVLPGQLEHAVPPSPLLNVSAGHGEQAPLDPEKPALQRHSVTLALELGDIEFAGQSMHAVLRAAEYFPAAHVAHTVLDTGAYFPATHSVHVFAFSLTKPALHVQNDTFKLNVKPEDCEFDGQNSH